MPSYLYHIPAKKYPQIHPNFYLSFHVDIQLLGTPAEHVILNRNFNSEISLKNIDHNFLLRKNKRLFSILENI